MSLLNSRLTAVYCKRCSKFETDRTGFVSNVLNRHNSADFQLIDIAMSDIWITTAPVIRMSVTSDIVFGSR